VKHRNISNVLHISSWLPATRARFYSASLLAAIGIFYFATIRPGHVWGDDFAMYVHHAQNIVEGRPYGDTGYIYNPAVPVYGPRMYPPVFPLLLAPLYKIFGLNLVPMKLEQVAFFLLTLAAVYMFWQRDLGSEYALAMLAILGFSPVFWTAKDMVLSDLPFLFFFYAAAVLVQRAPRQSPGWWRWAVLIGVVLYLAFGTRSAGISLLAGLPLYDVLKHRKITRLTVVALLVCAGLIALQRYFVGSGVGGYVGQQIRPTAQTVATNLLAYGRTLASFWVAATRSIFSFFVLGTAAVLMTTGLYFRFKRDCRFERGLTIVEAFLVPYLAVILLWPFAAGVRIVFPFIPWMVFLALYGIRCLTANLAPRYSSAAAGGLLLMIAVPYTLVYRAMDFGPIRQDTGLAEFNQLCQAVREDTRADDVLIYFRARALSLYTQRPASTYNYHGTEQELELYTHNIHATHVVTTNAFNDDVRFLAKYVERNSSRFDLVYQNANFALYRIRPDMQAQATLPPR
jgi:4-amino-4-deoxy-L-arabinose transferase-like glycosyltransferase